MRRDQGPAANFARRREKIVKEAAQLKTDLDSYNANNNPGEDIEIVFDFTEDVVELEALDKLRALEEEHDGPSSPSAGTVAADGG